MNVLQKNKSFLIRLILFTMIGVYFATICLINFVEKPFFYDPDMICDMNYAAKAWESKSIFPEGWVFGNQLYVFATPVVASVAYGLIGNQTIAMGIASTIMTVLVLLSFDWMVKSIFQDIETRLVGVFVLLAVVLQCGGPIYEQNGWQLLFTMCSYYACYAINAFLAFGCYVRSEELSSKCDFGILILTGVLSFGNGIQSLRQTAVMVGALLFVEFCNVIIRWYKKEKVISKSFWVAGGISVANLSGQVCTHLIDVEQVEVFGKIELANLSDWGTNFYKAMRNAASLLLDIEASHKVILLLQLLGLLTTFLYTLYKMYIMENRDALIILGLFIIGICGILLIDTVMEMSVREIYYFMLYPFVAYLVMCIYSSDEKILRKVVLLIIILCFGISCNGKISDAYEQCKRDIPNYEGISEFLEENSFTTIYAAWNYGGEILIEADWNMEVGFFSTYRAFAPVEYLCNPKVFEADSSECAYVFWGSEQAEAGIEVAREIGVEMCLMKYFPECDYYVYSSDVNIIKAFKERQ